MKKLILKTSKKITAVAITLMLLIGLCPLAPSADEPTTYTVTVKGGDCGQVTYGTTTSSKITFTVPAGQALPESANIIAEKGYVLDGYNIDAKNVKQVACGDYHTMVLKNDGTVWATGQNGNGQLGSGDTQTKNTFTQVPTITDVTQIACGGYHTVILKNDGTVWATGYNYYGQLGLGNNENNTTFTQVPNVGNVTQIDCGFGHTMILKNDGTVWATGNNYYGQLGLGNNENKTTFTQVPNVGNVTQIACGYGHTMVLKNDGTVLATGDNAYGQLGLKAIEIRNDFTQVPNVESITRIACGWNHTILLKNDGTVLATGDNAYGQLGLKAIEIRKDFTQVPNVESVTRIACGGCHTMLLKNDDTVWATGWNDYGQLGLDDTTSRNSFTQTGTTKIKEKLKNIKITGNTTITAQYATANESILVPELTAPGNLTYDGYGKICAVSSFKGSLDETINLEETDYQVTYEKINGMQYPESTTPPINAGQYKATVKLTDSTGYYNLTEASALFGITQATITVTPNENQSKTYGATDPEITYTSSDAVGNEKPGFTGALSYTGGTNVGNHDITQGTLALENDSKSGFLANNYKIEMPTPPVQFEIKAVPTKEDDTPEQKTDTDPTSNTQSENTSQATSDKLPKTGTMAKVGNAILMLTFATGMMIILKKTKITYKHYK